NAAGGAGPDRRRRRQPHLGRPFQHLLLARSGAGGRRADPDPGPALCRSPDGGALRRLRTRYLRNARRDRGMKLFRGLVGLLVVLGLAGCIDEGAGGARPDMIVVTEFAVTPATVVLDPSFGFSLYRGQPGVPQQQRATSIANAVGFLVSDTITERLRQLGYDTASTTDPNPRIDSRALIVTGAFRQIDEGHRRQVGAEQSAVVADVQVRATGPGARPDPVLSLHVDSRQLPRELAARGRETGV